MDDSDAEMLHILRDAIRFGNEAVIDCIIGRNGHEPALKMFPLPAAISARLLVRAKRAADFATHKTAW